MNLRHDHRRCGAHGPAVVAQSSRSQTSHANHSGSAAHILRPSQVEAASHLLGARPFFKPGQWSTENQRTPAGHIFTPDQSGCVPLNTCVRRSLQHGQMADGIHRMLAVRPLQPTQVTHGLHARLGWHLLHAVNPDTTSNAPSPRTTYGQSNRCAFPTPHPAGLLSKSRPDELRNPARFRRDVLLREPTMSRGPVVLRSRPSYRASQNLPERLLQRACAHLPLVPDQHDQEETWTST